MTILFQRARNSLAMLVICAARLSCCRLGVFFIGNVLCFLPGRLSRLIVDPGPEVSLFIFVLWLCDGDVGGEGGEVDVVIVKSILRSRIGGGDSRSLRRRRVHSLWRLQAMPLDP